MKKLVFIFGLMLLCSVLGAQSQSELLKGYETANCNVIKVIYDWQSRGAYVSKK